MPDYTTKMASMSTFVKEFRTVFFENKSPITVKLGIQQWVLQYYHFFSSSELAQGELLGYRDVRRPSYVWTSVTSETYDTSETSVRQLFSLSTL